MDAIDDILASIQKQMANGTMKATVGDYLRLLELKKEINEETATAITVTWVDSPIEEA